MESAASGAQNPSDNFCSNFPKYLLSLASCILFIVLRRPNACSYCQVCSISGQKPAEDRKHHAVLACGWNRHIHHLSTSSAPKAIQVTVVPHQVWLRRQMCFPSKRIGRFCGLSLIREIDDLCAKHLRETIHKLALNEKKEQGKDTTNVVKGRSVWRHNVKVICFFQVRIPVLSFHWAKMETILFKLCLWVEQSS